MANSSESNDELRPEYDFRTMRGVTRGKYAAPRFGINASVIQLLALLTVGSALDGGITQGACTLASLLFWFCVASLLWWRKGSRSRAHLFFFRWGLLAFVVIGTPSLRPVVKEWEWLLPLLYPGLAALIVLPAMYLVARVFGLYLPFDDVPRS